MDRYVVVEYQSVNSDVKAYLFDDKKDAKDYLLKEWKCAYGIWTDVDGDNLNVEECWHKECEAQVKWKDGKYIRLIMTHISQPNIYPL